MEVYAVTGQVVILDKLMEVDCEAVMSGFKLSLRKMWCGDEEDSLAIVPSLLIFYTSFDSLDTRLEGRSEDMITL